MKKLCYITVLAGAIVLMASCINDEEDTDLEIIAPSDSTVTGTVAYAFPVNR